MNKYFLEEIVLNEKGFLRGPFGGDLKKEIFVHKDIDTYKVYEQGVVLQKDPTVGNYYISKDYFDKKMKRFEVLPKDFLVSCSGVNYGAIYQLGEIVEEGVINQALLRIRLNNKIIDDNYFYYLFQHHLVNKIIGKKGDSTIPNFPPISVIKKLTVELPEIEIQKQIGTLLKCIDSKIELNNKINVELEAMAKLIYDYWFVQFDFPMSKEQAKAIGKPTAAGRPYKSSGGKMVYNKDLKREIPEGWEVKQLKDFAKTGSGGTPLSTMQSYYENGTIPWINSGEVNEPFIVKAEKFITLEGLNNSSAKMFKRGTILMAMYGATAGKVSQIDIEACTNQAICAINPNEEFYKTFVKFGLEDLYKYLVNLSSGSARDNLSQDKIKELQFVFPSTEILKRYHETVNSSMLKILVNMKENQKLSELRDWLLPMLMNGQVTIKDAQTKVVKKQAYTDIKPAKPYFYQIQLVAAIINASKRNKINHGEMTLAKYTYLVDKIYAVPTYFKFDRWHLGPYPKEMKKVVNNKKFFKIQNNEVTVVPQKKEYNYQFQQQVESGIAELASIFNEYSGKQRSRQTELIATVCKVVEDIKSTDLKVVRESMKKWPIKLETSKFKNKAEKFSEGETNAALKFIAKKGWVDALLKDDNDLLIAAEPKVKYSRSKAKI